MLAMKPTRFIRPALSLVLLCVAAEGAVAQATAVKPGSVPAVSRAARPASREAAAIDQLFRSAVKPGEPGVTVIVMQKGKALLRAAYGMANLELGVALAPEHALRIGSVTKQFTSAAIMALAEEGKLAVSDPITKYLPDYPTQGRTITVEHLLTHTSGIQSYTDMPKWLGMWRQDLTPAEIIGVFKNEPMQFAPGQRYRYNNSGYILLGAIIEKVTGKSYADFVRERIFAPLGMTHTRYDVTEDVIPGRAAGYARAAGKIVNAQYLSMTQPYAAGALISTVDDLAAWDEGLSAGRVVSAASLAKMFTPYKLASGNDAGYGYGWQIGQYEGLAVQEHGGGIHGFRAYVLRIPSERVYVAVLSNLAASEPNPGLLARKAAAIAVGKPLANPPAVSSMPEQLDAFVGRYRTPSGARHAVTREGTRMFVALSGEGRTEVFASAGDVFYQKDGFLRLRFERDPSGKVTRLIVDNWGAEKPAVRDDTPEKPAPVVVAVDPAVYRAYAGEYELAPGFILTVTVEGDRIMTQATGQSKVEIYPSSPTEFFLKVVDAQMTFVKDESGAVIRLVLHQGGRDMPAKKIK
jgi:D-alanyl-D-alanine carboxypeptidase